ATVSYLTDIVGSVTDANFDSYQLAIARADSDDFTVFAEGHAEVRNGLLGRLDTTHMDNDAYTLRVIASDINGLQSILDIPIAISGGAKLGNFTIQFTDLEVPVVGIPITISRVYDSLSSQDSGDFGFGWHLAVHEGRIRETVRTSQAQEDNP